MNTLIDNIFVKCTLAIIIGVFFVSCSKDLPGAMETSDKTTVLESIKIINAGENGDVVLVGTINEETKQITFPRIDPKTNLSNLKFEAIGSNGSVLQQSEYAIELSEQVPSKVLSLRLLNSPRYRDYFATLRLKIPPAGADFEQYQTFDYSLNPIGNPLYSTFPGSATRGSGFNGEFVLIVDRTGGIANPHLLKVSELKNNIINPIKLLPPIGETTFTGGTFTVHSGQIVGNHIYVASLAGAAISPLKIYHWTDPTKPAQVILNTTTSTVPGSGVRHGDNMSINLDNNGNGVVFFGDNAGLNVLKYNVQNFTTLANPTTFLTGFAAVGSWASYNQIGSTSNYLYTGHQAPLRVVSDAGVQSMSIPTTKLNQRLSDVRIVKFNKARYLIGTIAPRSAGDVPSLLVYDITRGDNEIQGLEYLAAAENPQPVFQYSLGGVDNINPATQTAYHVVKDGEGLDEKLMIFTATVNSGFVFFEFSKKPNIED